MVKEHVLADVARALEHEVLEEMRKAFEVRRIVHLADEVHEPHGDDGESIVAVENDPETVFERVAFVRRAQRDTRAFPIGINGRRARSAPEQRSREHHDQQKRGEERRRTTP